MIRSEPDKCSIDVSLIDLLFLVDYLGNIVMGDDHDD